MPSGAVGADLDDMFDAADEAGGTLTAQIYEDHSYDGVLVLRQAQKRYRARCAAASSVKTARVHVLTLFITDPVHPHQSCAQWLWWLRRALRGAPPLDRARYVHAQSTPRALAHLTQPSARTPSLQGSIFNATSAPPCAEHSRTG